MEASIKNRVKWLRRQSKKRIENSVIVYMKEIPQYDWERTCKKYDSKKRRIEDWDRYRVLDLSV